MLIFHENSACAIPLTDKSFIHTGVDRNKNKRLFSTGRISMTLRLRNPLFSTSGPPDLEAQVNLIIYQGTQKTGWFSVSLF